MIEMRKQHTPGAKGIQLNLLLLLLLPLAFLALGGCVSSQPNTPFLFDQLVPIVIMLMVLVLAFAYIGAEFFRIPAWRAYVGVEMFNLVLAVITIGFMFAAFVGAKYIAYELVGNDPVTAAKDFLNRIINKGVLPMYQDLLVIEAGTSLSNAFMIRIGPSVWSFVYKVEPGGDAILSMVRLMSFGLLAIYASLSFQYIALSAVDFAAPIALSLGVLLYIFPPTRDAGAFLICSAFAFQTVFPLIYALDEAILNDMSMQHFQTTYDAYIPQSGGFGRGASTVLSFLVPFASLVNFELLIPFINAMGHLALISLFLPALTMMITISMISAITKFLTGKT